MRKYIIVPVLLAVVLVMMCHCTSDRKATVPANEYLIQGELANLSDSIVIGLYVDEGNIFNLVARDTLLNGKFSFRDTVSVTKKMLIMSDNKGFPGTWLEVWIAPGGVYRNQRRGQITENLGSGERYPRTGGRKSLYGLCNGSAKRTDAAFGGRI